MTTHPLIVAARDAARELESESAHIEAARRVPAELSRRLSDRGFYRMLVPASLGGGEVAPRVFATVLEELARGDAAAAWVSMTASTTGLLMAYLDEAAAREILGDEPHAALAGVFAPSGHATPVEGGYRLTGRWAYASGCENARWRMGGALVYDGATPRRLAGGAPEIRSLFFREESSTVHDTWRVNGLRGTGSHDLAVEDIFVPDRNTTCVLSDAPRHDGALYRFPIFGLLATGVCAVGLGIARAAIDAMIAHASARRSRGGGKPMAEGEIVQVALATAEGELSAARALLHTTLAEATERTERGEPLSTADRARLRLAATHAATASARVVDDIYRLAGGAAIWDESALGRHFRDVHVMTQHVMVGPDTLKPVGRILLGLETDVTQL